MSGVKRTYTSVDTDELRRLRNRAQRAASLEESNRLLNQLLSRNDALVQDSQNRIRTLNNNINNLNNRLAKQDAAAKKEVQDLRTQLQNTIADSNRRITDAARKHEQQIQAMQQDFTNQLSETEENFNDALEQALEDMESLVETSNRRMRTVIQQNNQQLRSEMQNLQTQMQSEMANMQSQLNNVEATVGGMVAGNDTLLGMAREYANTAQMLLDDVQSNYRVELLCPGRLKPVLDAYNDSQSEIAMAGKIPTNASVARLQARQALERAVQLREEVMYAEQQWNMNYEATRQVLDMTETQIQSRQQVTLEEENATVNVNHWTAGDLDNLSNRLANLNGQMNNAQGLTITELNEIQSAGLQIGREVEDTTVFAAEAFFASQDRGEIAHDITRQLCDFGLSVIGHSYQGNDQRSAHRLHLRNGVTGFDIVITQTPEVKADGTIVNRLESDILNYGSLNQAHGDDIARSVLGSLSGLGFSQTPVSTVAGYETSASDRVEVANFETWRTETEPVIARPNRTEQVKTPA